MCQYSGTDQNRTEQLGMQCNMILCKNALSGGDKLIWTVCTRVHIGSSTGACSVSVLLCESHPRRVIIYALNDPRGFRRQIKASSGSPARVMQAFSEAGQIESRLAGRLVARAWTSHEPMVEVSRPRKLSPTEKSTGLGSPSHGNLGVATDLFSDPAFLCHLFRANKNPRHFLRPRQS